ncbi:MAG: hypothetical protein OQJ96_11940 [Flavobacteriales bacterium]|nr:hypothetical protein [Flavobacteriales bacterium]MCW8913857.1 hypothetical protein [Flavobacteriales bacterium]MCW8937973.1 hypothetical protein [Flavobacteriales bacterium]MCW8940217.1 hypothetical protein [Flavobacteriales bacterium]MCW8968402.1 hypothetical protein [Flavobacteriales bacterium]
MKLTYNILKAKSICLLMFCLTFSLIASAQQKQHYVLHSTNPNVDLTVYQNAIENWGKLDEFRLLDERRIISFFDEHENEAVNVELLSANELKQAYNKRIPNFISSGKRKIRKATFKLTPNKQSVIVRYLKK